MVVAKTESRSMFHGTSYSKKCLRIRIPKLLPHLWYKGHDISDAKPNMKEMTTQPSILTCKVYRGTQKFKFFRGDLFTYLGDW